MAAVPAAKAAAEAWLRGEGVTWEAGALEICTLEGGAYSGAGLAVVARRDLKEGEVLCTIPKTALLSVRNSEVADLVEEEQLGGGLGLVFVVTYEMCRGKLSKWYGYFQSMPEREYLPIFWSDAELKLLKGTELDGRVETDRELARSDYDEAIAPLLEKYPDRLPASMTYDAFARAASLVASRAFGVDEWHGESMVPLADIFNHKASIVSLSGGYQIMDTSGAQVLEDSDSGQGDNDSDAQKDSAVAGSGDQGDGPGDEVGAVDSDESDGEDASEEEHGMAPVLFAGGASRPPIRSDEEIPSRLRLEIGICSASSKEGEDVEDDLLQIIAASDIPAGAEVHNTYGELSNAELVNKYGFALRDNPFDVVTLQKELLVASAEEAMGEAAHDRTGFLLEQTSLLDDDVEPLEVMADGRIGPALVAALLIIGASDEEFSQWKSAGDAFPWLASEDSDSKPGEDGGHATGTTSETLASRQEPQWMTDGGLKIEAATAASLNPTMCQVLASTLKATLASRYSDNNVTADEAKLKVGAASSSPDVSGGAAQHTALILKAAEMRLLQAALDAVDGIRGSGPPSNKRLAADSATDYDPNAKKAKR